MKLTDLQAKSPIFDTAPNPNAKPLSQVENNTAPINYLRRAHGIVTGKVVAMQYYEKCQQVLTECGILVHTSMELEAFLKYVMVNDMAFKVLNVGMGSQDAFTQKRLRNIIQMFRLQASKRNNDNETLFSFYAIADSVKAKLYQLKAVVGVENEKPWLCFVMPDTNLLP